MYKDTYKRIEREYEIKRNLADKNYRELKEIDIEISKLRNTCCKAFA